MHIMGSKENGYGDIEGEFFCNCINQKIYIVYDKNLNLDYVDKAIKHLDYVYPKLIHDFCRFIMSYCKDFMREYPDVDYKKGLKQLKKNSDILNYIEFGTLKVRDYNDSIVLNFSGGCDWADEKGFQWIIQDEKIVYVGPWYDFDIDSPDLGDPFFNYCTRS